MSERRPKDPTPDLFAAAASMAPPPAERNIAPRAEVAPINPPASVAYLLPKDLPSALKRLHDVEIDTLLAAVTEEAKRRGRLPPGVTRATTKPADVKPAVERVPRPVALKEPASPRPQEASDYAAPVLSVGKTNAVRAAFMAGVKPSAIARQFGVSQAAVRQVLAAATRGRKP